MLYGEENFVRPLFQSFYCWLGMFFTAPFPKFFFCLDVLLTSRLLNFVAPVLSCSWPRPRTKVCDVVWACSWPPFSKFLLLFGRALDRLPLNGWLNNLLSCWDVLWPPICPRLDGWTFSDRPFVPWCLCIHCACAWLCVCACVYVCNCTHLHVYEHVYKLVYDHVWEYHEHVYCEVGSCS